MEVWGTGLATDACFARKLIVVVVVVGASCNEYVESGVGEQAGAPLKSGFAGTLERSKEGPTMLSHKRGTSR